MSQNETNGYYLTYDLPIPYSKQGSEEKLVFYPISLREYLFVNVYSDCLTFDKNSSRNRDIILMTDLEYLYYVSQDKQLSVEKPYVFYLDRLLALSLKEDKSFLNMEKSSTRYGYNKNKKPRIKLGNTFYDSIDFENIRTIICQQNKIELPDTNLSKEVRDSIDEARFYKNKENKPATLEELIVSLSVATGWKIEEIYDMNIRKFLLAINRMDNLIHYKIYLGASMSGMVTFKDNSFIKHWLSSLELTGSQKYKDVTMSMEALHEKIG